MTGKAVFAAFSLMAMTLASAAQAECSGGNGRGWSNGHGSFEMSGKDGGCRIGYPGFICEDGKRCVPATEMTLTRVPRSASRKT
ncbi:hypothetical protein [Pseudogemmobacter bohemicus]|uniref:hypothetical protein n=1 Tax=Pseudogemmobacter bohemicus TaxID=2250708 RepID=UPI000DD3F967|nr:hypothetical protein [Pseudogemmobacter bohemicus]